MERIPVAGPWITEREVRYAADAAEHGWYHRAGDYPKRFEQALAQYIGVEHAVSLPHCTAGIHLALVAMKVGPGDEVIVPDATWIASAAPINYVGATPVFVDVDRRTWCMDAAAFENAITPRTKAVIPVNLYGSMPDWPAIRRVADRHKVRIIEDAAEAIGSTLGGRKAGSFGDVGVYSFHGSKTLTTGEGGMLTTNDKALFDRILFLRDHGRPPGDRYFRNTEVAFKYKMSPLQAAVGLAQIERIEELVARKREIFAWYAEYLKDVPGVTLNAEPIGVRNSYWMVTAIVDAKYGLTSRDLMARFDEHQIDTRPFFAPLTSLPAYANHPQVDSAAKRNVVSYDLCPRGLNLPSAMCLTREQVERVCQVLKGILSSVEN
ncbi:MAG: aminotransferase class I/II-fold pyridoxal phosphate-dependent enzyme [Planctomycetes bacterium]|nr:aminotransferase class I/II-fold pyridoxal phosphate-dependent enzyme [Planctomycetota bacterium]